MNGRVINKLRWPAILTSVLVLLILTAGNSFSETPSEATAITLFAPKVAQFGDAVRLSARLVDANSAPISGVNVTFLAPEVFFLGVTGDIVIAEVLTNRDGVAETEYRPRNTGWLAVRVEFRGNDRYAATRDAASFFVDGTAHQLYVERVGVQVPWLNVPPSRSVAEDKAIHEAVEPPTGIAALWPRLSFWPIAVVLGAVWFLYAVAVRQMFTIAFAGSAGLGTSSPTRRPRAIAGGAIDDDVVQGSSDNKGERR